MSFLVGVDLGATNASVAVVTEAGAVQGAHAVRLQGLEPVDVVHSIRVAAEEAVRRSGADWAAIRAVGVGTPGAPTPDGVIPATANFPTWADVPLRELVSAALHDKPVVVANDADCAAAAELWIGAGASPDVRDIVMVTLGSGVGVGILAQAKLVAGATGCIEGGHAIAQIDGRPCGCGQRGCIEAYVSANSVAKRAAEGLTTPAAQGSALQSLATVECKDVFEAADAGDRYARAVVDETARYLGVFCLNIVRMLDPAMIVFAGGMAKAGETLLAPVRRHYAEQSWRIRTDPCTLELARVGEHAGAIGAAYVASTSSGGGGGGGSGSGGGSGGSSGSGWGSAPASNAAVPPSRSGSMLAVVGVCAAAAAAVLLASGRAPWRR